MRKESEGYGDARQRGAKGIVSSEGLTPSPGTLSQCQIFFDKVPHTLICMPTRRGPCRVANSDSVVLGCGLRFFLCL